MKIADGYIQQFAMPTDAKRATSLKKKLKLHAQS
jgi:hypothetical protein